LIVEAIARKVKDRLPGCALRVEPNPDAHGGLSDLRILVPAAHPEVGDLVIWDDGDEATVFVGAITHIHMTPYDTALSKEQAAERIADEVTDFIENLFADRVLMWRAFWAGGCKTVDRVPTRAPHSWPRRWFLWSGPLPK
jgi:hypothetical protein